MALVPWKTKRAGQQNGDEFVDAPLARFRSEMDQLFNRFLGRDWDLVGSGFTGYSGLGEWMPSLDVTESDKEVTVRAEVPGVDPKDLDITVSGNVLTISGEKKETTERKGESFFHSERHFGRFRRTLQLDCPVDSSSVSAAHKNGVVEIRMNKQPDRSAKRIEVKAG